MNFRILSFLAIVFILMPVSLSADKTSYLSIEGALVGKTRTISAYLGIQAHFFPLEIISKPHL